jgi:hypothetical protein
MKEIIIISDLIFEYLGDSVPILERKKSETIPALALHGI